MIEKRFAVTQTILGSGIYDFQTEDELCESYDEDAYKEVVRLLNKLHEEKEQLLSDKEHLMGCLIRFFCYDDEDIDYNLNRESNREFGKQYYSMKEKGDME